MRTISDVTFIRHALLGPGGRPEQFDDDVRDRLDQLVVLHGRLSQRGWELSRESTDVEIQTWIWPESVVEPDGSDTEGWTELWVTESESGPIRGAIAQVVLVGDPIELPSSSQPRQVAMDGLTDDLLEAAERHQRGDERPLNWRW